MAPNGRPSTRLPAWQRNDQISFHSSSATGPRIGSRVVSLDGRRVISSSRRVSQPAPKQSHDQQTPAPDLPAILEDPYSSWTPNINAVDATPVQLGEKPSATGEKKKQQQDQGAQPAAGESQTGEKRKRYQSSDDPMGHWLPAMPTFLEEMFRRDGLGARWHTPACLFCEPSEASEKPTRFFRCMDCDECITCLDCVLKRHRHTPLHCIEEWNGDFWQRTSLRDIGLVFTFDHPTTECPGKDQLRELLIIDVNGLHRVQTRYCTCRSQDAASHLEQILRAGWYPATATDPHFCATFRVLDLFRLLNVVANVNGHDFYKSLEELSDPCQLQNLPDRYTSFVRMERQYAFLLRVKRSGRPYRVATLGDVAVLCWGCPQEGMNLPRKWKSEPPETEFLHQLIVAVDANFRLKNRIRANEQGHPSLGSGSSYFVELGPYKEHIKKYVAEEDISTCIAFAALVEKDTKVTTGLRTSGVAGVVCARHELVRPLGIGDLQKGERYSNMDYVLLSSIMGLHLKRITVSYNIGCQWKINLLKRIQHLPSHLHLDDVVRLQFGLPTWHAVVHELECRSQNSLGYQDGVGRTDGEGIERTWSVLNGAAWSTKEMGEGSRHDHLDDRINHHNYRKNIGHGETLARRLIIAEEEFARQESNYQQLTSSLKPEIQAEWQVMIDDWNADRSCPNPYLLGGEHKNPTEAQVRADLKKEEAEEAAAGKTPLRGTTVATFLALGLRIEGIQLKLRCLSASSSLSLGNQAQVHERRVSILSQLKRFRNLQALYMPGAIRCIEEEEKRRPSDAAPPLAECIRLWMPSEIPLAERPSAIVRGLASAEAQLRKAQCTDSLVVIRRHLHEKQHLVAWRDDNAVGQGMATRGRTLIDNVGDKVTAAVSKYRIARTALGGLLSKEDMSSFPPLLDSDLTTEILVEDDALAQRRLAALTSKNRRQHVSHSRDTVSWIWTSHLGPEDRRHGLDEAIRVNWSKSQLRVKQWGDEVKLIGEEMRRVLQSTTFMSKRWEEYAGSQSLVDAPLSHGRRAYAMKQAHYYSRLHDRFKRIWSSPFGKNKVVVAYPSELQDPDDIDD